MMPEMSLAEFEAHLRAEHARRRELAALPRPRKPRARRRRKPPPPRAGGVPGAELFAADPCAYCCGPATTYDHIEPQSRGGENSVANLTRCCWSCNKAKARLSLLVFLIRRATGRAIRDTTGGKVAE